ncbi:hypothetical protein Dimus_037591 [Dionaea muscipula]
MELPAVVSVTYRASLSSVFLVLENGRYLSRDQNNSPCSMGLHPSLNVVGCVRTPLSERERKDFSKQLPRFQTQESTFPYEHSVHVSVRGRVKESPLLRISFLILDRSSEGSSRFIAVLTH